MFERQSPKAELLGEALELAEGSSELPGAPEEEQCLWKWGAEAAQEKARTELEGGFCRLLADSALTGHVAWAVL